MADSEVRQKFQIVKQAELSYEVLLDGEHIEEFTDKSSAGEYVRWFSAKLDEAYSAGMRAGEIARWIPVEEKLPERPCYYLVYRHPAPLPPRVDMCWHNPTSPSDMQFWKAEVTHWQARPAAPEEKP